MTWQKPWGILRLNWEHVRKGGLRWYKWYTSWSDSTSYDLLLSSITRPSGKGGVICVKGRKPDVRFPLNHVTVCVRVRASVSVCHRQLPEQVSNRRASLFYVAITHSPFCLFSNILVMSPNWVSLLHVSERLKKVILCSNRAPRINKAWSVIGFYKCGDRRFFLTYYKKKRTDIEWSLAVPLQLSNLLLCPSPVFPEVVQKSISDFPFNTCEMVKVHTVLSDMGHFGRGGVFGGEILEIKAQIQRDLNQL